MIRLTYKDNHGSHSELYSVEEAEYTQNKAKRLRKLGWKVTVEIL